VLSKTTIKLNPDLCRRALRIAEHAGCSLDEFVAQVLEKELAHFEESDTKEDIIDKLKKLGYLE
jgi:hypothetical protein